MKLKLAILGSGKGSNCKAILEAIDEGRLDAEVVLVMADNPDAGILRLAKKYGVDTEVIPECRFRTKLDETVETKVAERIRKSEADLVVLAGYMRMVKSPMLKAFPGRIINIHPSLLPKFKGLEAWRQALEAGEKMTGCTVHYVDAGMDTGSVIARQEVPILDGDTPESLHARIQIAEHSLYPKTLANLAGKLMQGENEPGRKKS